MKKISKKKYLAFFLFVILLSILAFMCIKYYEKIEKERKIEARFDRFMGYYYPYLKDIAEASNLYKRMKVSLMYDYISYRKGRYVYENVNYFDGGTFSMQQELSLMSFLEESKMLYFARCYGPIDCATKSRVREKRECLRVLYSVKELLAVDIYDNNIALYGRHEDVRNTIDSLNSEIQQSLYNLSKYRESAVRINLNSISESDYNLDNY